MIHIFSNKNIVEIAEHLITAVNVDASRSLFQNLVIMKLALAVFVLSIIILFSSAVSKDDVETSTIIGKPLLRGPTQKCVTYLPPSIQGRENAFKSKSYKILLWDDPSILALWSLDSWLRLMRVWISQRVMLLDTTVKRVSMHFATTPDLRATPAALMVIAFLMCYMNDIICVQYNLWIDICIDK